MPYTLGNPNSDPKPLPSTKYSIPSSFKSNSYFEVAHISILDVFLQGTFLYQSGGSKILHSGAWMHTNVPSTNDSPNQIGLAL